MSGSTSTATSTADPSSTSQLVFAKENIDTSLEKRSSIGGTTSALARMLLKSNQSSPKATPRQLDPTPSNTSTTTTSTDSNPLANYDGTSSQPSHIPLPYSCHVYVPGNATTPLRHLIVHMTQPCTVQALIEAVLQHGAASIPSTLASTSSSTSPVTVTPALLSSLSTHIEVIAADDSGSPDEDCPSLDSARPIHQFGLDHFLLRSRDTQQWDITHLQLPDTHVYIGSKSNFALAEPSAQLFHASEEGFLDDVRHLIESGYIADINAQGINNWTALHFATRKGHLPIVNYLLKHDANVDAVTKTLWTPLHFASDRGHYDIAEVLLTCGAEPSPRDTTGKTPLTYAKSKGYSDIVSLLEEFQSVE